jgi:predicted Fe-Mo cluster-binding NifX family protein
MKFKVSFATNDGKTLVNSHFGDAEIYPIYEIDENEIKFLMNVNNTTEEEDEEIHGDPRKAQGISQLMKPYGVQVLCGKQFGKNIVRMVKKFVPVLVSVSTVEEATKLIQNNLKKIHEQWQNGENRRHLRI